MDLDDPYLSNIVDQQVEFMLTDVFQPLLTLTLTHAPKSELKSGTEPNSSRTRTKLEPAPLLPKVVVWLRLHNESNSDNVCGIIRQA